MNPKMACYHHRIFLINGIVAFEHDEILFQINHWGIVEEGMILIWPAITIRVIDSMHLSLFQNRISLRTKP